MTQPLTPPVPSAVPLPLPDLSVWVFDLDNTLYPASSSLFPQIDVKMRQFVAERLNLPLDEAYRVQKQYYRDHGTTMRGLMLHHGVEPEEFMDYVHDIDCTVLQPCARLDSAIEALPGRKVIFTNGSEKHAVNVLNRMGLSRHFNDIFDIAAAGYIPKPQPETYELMVRRHAIDPRRAAMFEDIHRNLVPAHVIGMTTVWLRQDNHPDFQPGPSREAQPGDLAHVDHIIEDLAVWLEGAVGP